MIYIKWKEDLSHSSYVMHSTSRYLSIDKETELIAKLSATKIEYHTNGDVIMYVTEDQYNNMIKNPNTDSS